MAQIKLDGYIKLDGLLDYARYLSNVWLILWMMHLQYTMHNTLMTSTCNNILFIASFDHTDKLALLESELLI